MDKLKPLFGILVFAPVLGLAQSSAENYFKTTTILDANGTNAMTSVQYYNGLGYPTVAVGNTGGGGETAYSLVTYDGMGRESRKYVPVSGSLGGGSCLASDHRSSTSDHFSE